MNTFEQQVAAAREWCASPRFAGIQRLHSAREVAEQQGTIAGDYTVARRAAEEFYARLRQLFAERKSITTFGPYSPGQARHDEAGRHRGHLPGRLGHVSQGIRSTRIPGPTSRAIP